MPLRCFDFIHAFNFFSNVSDHFSIFNKCFTSKRNHTMWPNFFSFCYMSHWEELLTNSGCNSYGGYSLMSKSSQIHIQFGLDWKSWLLYLLGCVTPKAWLTHQAYALLGSTCLVSLFPYDGGLSTDNQFTLIYSHHFCHTWTICTL